MLKKIITIMLTMLMASSLVFADNDLNETPLSRQSAVDMVIKNSKSRIVNQSEIDAASVALEEAKLNQYRALSNNSLGIFNTTLERNGYFVRLAEMSLKLAELGLSQGDIKDAFLVQSEYYSYQNTIQKVKICDNILAYANDNLKQAEQKKQLGLASDMDLIYAQTAVYQAKVEKDTTQNNADFAQKSFNNSLGVAQDRMFNLTDELKCEKYPEIDIKEKVALATSNRMEIIAAKEQMEVDQKNFECSEKYYMPNTFAYKKAKLVAEKSALNYNIVLSNVELSVYKAYYDMVNSYQQLGLIDALIFQQQKAYDITVIKYEQGLTPNSEVTDALNKLQETQLNKAQAVLGYNLAKVKFESCYGLGLGI